MHRGGSTARLRAGLLAAVAATASALALLVQAGGALERVELASVDARFSLRGPAPVPDDLAVVAIDPRTFSDLRGERFPFDRRIFARVLRRLDQAGARLIVYDVQFTEPQGDSDADVRADNALIEASRRARRVVLSTTEVAENGATRVFGGAEVQRYARATVGNGLLPADPGRVLRRLPYEIDGLPTLAVAAVERLGRPVDRRRLAGRGAWIDFAGPAGHIRTYGFSRVLRGDVPAEALRDRIVVIGASAPVLQDRHPVPFGPGMMAGAEVHANAIRTLLRGVPLQGVDRALAMVVALLAALVVPLAALRLRLPVAAAAGLTLLVLYLVAAHIAFGEGRILPVVGPVLALAAGSAGTLAVHALASGVERARVRDLFARFVPDAVVDQVVERAGREDLRLGGVRLLSTVLFSDLRGFTDWAEERDPEEVIRVLNRYLEAMSDAILDHGGTLVAYMGDGIMSVFGAPVASDDHADRALGAAKAMLDRLQAFNAWIRTEGLGEGFAMGIGLNTGPVMSGNVGSSRRMEYTAVGDTTNTAARLEAMTKDSGRSVFLSDAVRAALTRPEPALEEVGELPVRGRGAPVRVWTLG